MIRIMIITLILSMITIIIRIMSLNMNIETILNTSTNLIRNKIIYGRRAANHAPGCLKSKPRDFMNT